MEGAVIPARYRRLRKVLDRRQPDLTVLMERVNKSHNFSAILRNCDAVGVLEAHVVPPEKDVEVHPGTSAGASKWVRVHQHTDARAAVQYLRGGGHQIVAAHPGEEAVDFREVDFTAPTAVMVGAELHGISHEGLALADRVVAIPMVGMVRSLNVSVATSLLLFEALRQREAAGLYDRPRLDPERYHRLLFEWGYPRLAGILAEQGRPYPALDDEGRIIR